MIRIVSHDDQDVVTVRISLSGSEFEADLKPLRPERLAQVLKRFRKQRQVVNPLTKAMETIYSWDDNDDAFGAAMDDLYCDVLVDFRGIGDENGAWDGKLRENKIALARVWQRYDDIQTVKDPATGTEAQFVSEKRRTIREAIIERAQELAAAHAEADAKN